MRLTSCATSNEHSPPILNKSKVEMTACSGCNASCPAALSFFEASLSFGASLLSPAGVRRMDPCEYGRDPVGVSLLGRVRALERAARTTAREASILSI